MRLRLETPRLLLASLLVVGAAVSARGQDKEDPAETAVRAAAQQVTKAFNAAKADDVAKMFLPKGELIDEEGVVYQGQQEITELLKAFFTRFPGAKVELEVESVRLVGPVAIEEGTRTMSSSDGALKSRFRYIAVWAKSERGWQLASFRDFADDPVPTPHDFLQPLEWLVGDWINEGADGKVTITYRWSEEKNFLLGEFVFQSADGPSRSSTQRLGWDPSAGRIRSWLFDSDGGFAEGVWAVVEDGVVIQSASVNPDGTTATATLTIVPSGQDRFTLAGTHRIVADVREPDFEITVTRRPPAAGK